VSHWIFESFGITDGHDLYRREREDELKNEQYALEILRKCYGLIYPFEAEGKPEIQQDRCEYFRDSTNSTELVGPSRSSRGTSLPPTSPLSLTTSSFIPTPDGLVSREYYGYLSY
jgi:hypothetical protein